MRLTAHGDNHTEYLLPVKELLLQVQQLQNALPGEIIELARGLNTTNTKQENRALIKDKRRLVIMVHPESSGRHFCARLVNKIFAGLSEFDEVIVRFPDENIAGVEANILSFDESAPFHTKPRTEIEG